MTYTLTSAHTGVAAHITFDTLLHYGLQEAASDIHIEHNAHCTIIRMRVHGVLRQTHMLTHSQAHTIVNRIKVLCGMDCTQDRIPQDGTLRIMADHRCIETRIATFPSQHGEKVAIRFLHHTPHTTQSTVDADELSELISHIAQQNSGLYLCAGPTGSGKTTTLSTILHAIDRTARNVVTLEDPIEYHIAATTQSQITPHGELTFATALRSLLRQDPDVILIGEIRDGETAQIALEAALTGHLVLSSIHTRNASAVFARLTDMGVARYLQASCIGGIIAQRLIPNDHGSRTMAWEALLPDKTLQQALLSNELRIEEIEAHAHRLGMTTLKERIEQI